MSQPDTSLDEKHAEGFDAVPVEITIRVGRFRRRLHELLELKKGDVVTLNRRIGQSFDLLVERLHVAWVDPVACEERVTVKLARVVETKQ